MKLVRFHHLKNEAISSRFPRTGLLLANDTIADLRVGFARYLTQERKDPQGREIAALRIAPDIVSMIALGNPAREALDISNKYLSELLSSKPEARGPTGEPLFMQLADCKLHAPIRPSKVVALERGRTTGKGGYPSLRIKANNTINSPYRDIVMPAGTTQLECETMLTVIIGKGGNCISEGKAQDSIFAYMLANDVSSLDGDYPHDMFNTFLPIGPWVVTKDEVEDPMDLKLSVLINGTSKRKDAKLEMRTKIGQLIAHVSGIVKLEPGDIVLAGGAGPLVLRLGDTIECTVEKLGTLRNRVGDDPSK